MFRLFRYRFETPKQTEIFLFFVSRNKPKQTRNRSCFGFFRFEPKFIFVCFEDTLGVFLSSVNYSSVDLPFHHQQLWTCRVYPSSPYKQYGRAGCISVNRQHSRRAGCISVNRQHSGRAGCISVNRQHSGRAGCISVNCQHSMQTRTLYLCQLSAQRTCRVYPVYLCQPSAQRTCRMYLCQLSAQQTRTLYLCQLSAQRTSRVKQSLLHLRTMFLNARLEGHGQLK